MSIHKDLWENVLLNLNYREIIYLCANIKEIDDYCKEQNILNKRKIQGFPRVSERCKTHDANKFFNEIHNLNIDENLNQLLN